MEVIMKSSWNIRKIGAVALLMTYSVSSPLNYQREYQFESLNGSQVATLALCAGAGIVLGIAWDISNPAIETDGQPISRTTKIARRITAAVCGGVLGGIIGIGQLQQHSATPGNRENQRRPQPARPTTNRSNPQPRQAAQSPQPNNNRAQTTAHNLEGDCPICLEEIKSIPRENLVQSSCCKKPFCKKCLITTLRSKRECPLCRSTTIVITQ